MRFLRRDVWNNIHQNGRLLEVYLGSLLASRLTFLTWPAVPWIFKTTVFSWVPCSKSMSGMDKPALCKSRRTRVSNSATKIWKHEFISNLRFCDIIILFGTICKSTTVRHDGYDSTEFFGKLKEPHAARGPSEFGVLFLLLSVFFKIFTILYIFFSEYLISQIFLLTYITTF